MTVPIYFAFPDGAFHYVCAECTALCCRGQGFAGSLEREMGQLIQLYPNLASAVLERRGPLLTVATPAGRCHFLEDDDLCRIEKEHGRALKPGVCLLFPFNSFSLIGRTLVVSPHFLCPLRLSVPARPGQVEGTHARLEPLIRETGMVTETALRMADKPLRLHPSEGVRSVLTREVAFRDRCGAALGVGSFAHTVREAARDPVRLNESIYKAAALLGLEVPSAGAGRDALDDIFLATAPSLRLRFVDLPADGILLAAAVAELVVRHLTLLSSTAPTPQGVVNLIDGVTPALHLLGLEGEPVRSLRRGAPKAPPFGDPAMVFAGYRLLKKVASSTSLLDTLEEEMRGLPWVADRTAFLVEMGSLIGRAPRSRRSD